jgi:hypothetical protein
MSQDIQRKIFKEFKEEYHLSKNEGGFHPHEVVVSILTDSNINKDGDILLLATSPCMHKTKRRVKSLHMFYYDNKSIVLNLFPFKHKSLSFYWNSLHLL